MHDTAFHIGNLAMNIYADLRTDSILEVGSQSINGSLRENALPSTHYVGLDIGEGEGVDIVIEPGKPFPVEDDAFDLVIASSVFEHDPFFWMTFLEMCRVTKEGGYIYVNAPSNGVVHRYPQDNWRFYPDSGRALAQWAISQGMSIGLVESFIAKREADIWNDFVAVFRKGRITKSMPKVFIHDHVPCTDVITWKSKEIVKPSDRMEDAILLEGATERAQAAEEQLLRLSAERDAVQSEADRQLLRLSAERDAVQSEADRQLLRLSAERDAVQSEADRLKEAFSEAERQRQLQVEEAGKVRADLGHRDSELRQRQEEIEQTRSELLALRAEQAELRAELSRHKEKAEAEATGRSESERVLASVESLYKAEQSRALELVETQRDLSRQAEKLRSQIRLMERELDIARQELVAADADVQKSAAELDQLRLEQTATEARLHDRFREITTMTELLAQSEDGERRSRQQLEWLCEASLVLSNGRSTSVKGRLFRMLPAVFESRRQRRLLKHKGLFDADAYLAAHPDVAADRVDALSHYLRHGIGEDRRRD